ALAGVGAARGYRVSVVMPDSMSAERRQLIQALGAQIILTAGAAGMAGALHKAEELLQADPERYFMPQQFKNPANPAIHEQTTGPEIWQATAGAVDVVISGVGTGGTLTGIARYFKHRRAKPILSVAVEPAASPLLAQKKAGQPLRPAPHGLQGLGANFIPQTLDWALVDRIEPATEEEALEYAQRLAREEGILAGISSGAAMAVAARLARTAAFEGQRLVVILPDSGERYLSTDLYRLAH
ncbi:MAG: pyridoxal-phosphate dependent enzyme, partial [Lentisphaerae bacterium]|nr:pyridoxal-phosphate dependent enzyme [Lentisphaerota bacterium]